MSIIMIIIRCTMVNMLFHKLVLCPTELTHILRW